MDLLKQYILPVAIIIGVFVLDYRTRHRKLLLKQALFMNFIAASFCACLHSRRDFRVAMIMFLFIVTITSLAAVLRWLERRRFAVTPDIQCSLQKDRL